MIFKNFENTSVDTDVFLSLIVLIFIGNINSLIAKKEQKVINYLVNYYLPIFMAYLS